MGRLWICKKGTAAIEMAFILPLLLLLILGIVEFGRAMWIRQTLQFAVEEAARSAIADATLNSTDIGNLVTADMIGVQGATPTVTATATASQVSIFASYNFTFLAPQLLPFGPLALTAQCVFPR